MTWDTVTLFILAFFGALILLLSQIQELLAKAHGVIQAWREFRECLEVRSEGDEPDDSGASCPCWQHHQP
ncbi:hypothetical protein [Streptomyces sp. 8N616]|uniref:hypothetical protein n=1 Tax=Streptomyces sp. 8N616 TaxID=3457414 RepID=UPI003FD580E1